MIGSALYTITGGKQTASLYLFQVNTQITH